ncbi:MAG: PD-(D/E)XK nuclease family protein [Mycobacteriaceae bacterium]
MPTQLLKVTPSRLATWAGCKRRFRMTYLDRPTPPRGGPWAHSTLGAVVHAALRTFYATPPARRTASVAQAALAAAWTGEGFADAAQQAVYRARAQDWVAGYVSDHDPREVDAVGLERWVSAPVGELVVEGRVDRIDARSRGQHRPPAPDAAEVVVVDYKTGQRGLSVAAAAGSQALALYVLASRHTLRRPCSRVELHHLPTGEVHGFDHTPATLAQAVQHAQEQAQAIARATKSLVAGGDPEVLFPPRPAPSCSWCDFRRSCPEGAAASPRREPWAGLAP